MLSSIFNSKVPTRAHIVLLLALCAAFCASVELVTAHLFGRVSRIEKRRETEYRDALAIRSARTRHKTSVLVAGNSLLLHGVDFPQLQQDIGMETELHRTVFENTSFFDWHYGLQRIFNAGAQPDVTVLVLSPAQLTSDAYNGDYSAHMLVDFRDLMRFAKDTRADRNRISVLALDNLSFFFGSRAEIRTWILGMLLPDLPVLTSHFRYQSKGEPPDNDAVQELATQRLNQLRSLCESHGTEFVLVVPPTIQDSGINAVLKAGASQGVPVLIPFPPGVLSSSDYSDEVHLNANGAMKFTRALAQSLKQSMPQDAAPAETASGSPTATHGVRNLAMRATQTNLAMESAPAGK
jgi:hypothetical protein